MNSKDQDFFPRVADTQYDSPLATASENERVPHTPGPWIAEYSHLDAAGWRVKSAQRQEPPYDAYADCWVNLAYSGEVRARANACLIAAAPDLFAVLKAICEDAVGQSDDPLHIVDRDLLSAGRSLLARVERGTP